MFRKAFLSVLVPGFAGFSLLLAIFVTTTTLTPDVAHAVPSPKELLEGPGNGGGQNNVGQGDDDQPTITPPPSRRTGVQVAEPESRGATGGSTRYANLNLVRRFVVTSRDLLQRLVWFVP
jgi:hypothetical protein